MAATGGNDGMASLIPMMNKLQDAYSKAGFSALHVDLPMIVVVGQQSAGKSSVLENFVGRDFLPRGSGIVTRCPLILQLKCYPQEYAEFLHLPGKHFTDWEAVRKEIEDETERVTGKTKNVSPKAIRLAVFSPQVLDLTLVDLPGLTQVAIQGQPVDIARQIKDMVMHFVTQDNALILAVCAANSDLANSEALRIAREVDPNGERTIGVLTKLDLMDEGTDARDVLDNKVLALRRGYIPIVNRSQKDIDGRIDIKAALSKERAFFLKHPSYRHMADRAGAAFLQKTLNVELTSHIKRTLPRVKQQLMKEFSALEREAEDIKKFRPDDPTAKTKRMMTMLHEFGSNLVQRLWGSSLHVDDSELSGGARINKIFFERFVADIMLVHTNEKELQKEIAFAIRNTHGVRTGLFTPDLAFEVVVRKQISRLTEPAMKCVDMVIQELQSVIHNCAECMAGFPDLREDCEQLVNDRIRESENVTKEQIKLWIDFQLAYINTNHPDFKDQDDTTARQATNAGRVGNKPQHKGWITISATGKFGGNKEFWFVLTPEELQWYADDSERDKKYTVSTNELKIRDASDTGGIFTGKKAILTLFYSSQKNVYKEHRTLDLVFRDQEDLEAWRAALMTKAGVHPDNAKEEEKLKNWNLVDSASPMIIGDRHAGELLCDDNTGATSQFHIKMSSHMMINQNGGGGQDMPPPPPGPMPANWELTKPLQAGTEHHTTISTATRNKRRKDSTDASTKKDSWSSNQDPEDGLDSGAQSHLNSATKAIYSLYQSYMSIIVKQFRDCVPKMIMHLMVIALKEYCESDLKAQIYTKDLSKLMNESPDEVQRRDEIMRMYTATKEALEVIREVNMNYQDAKLPPPVDNSWIKPGDGPSASFNRGPSPRPGGGAPPGGPARPPPNVPGRAAPGAPPGGPPGAPPQRPQAGGPPGPPMGGPRPMVPGRVAPPLVPTRPGVR